MCYGKMRKGIIWFLHQRRINMSWDSARLGQPDRDLEPQRPRQPLPALLVLAAESVGERAALAQFEQNALLLGT